MKFKRKVSPKDLGKEVYYVFPKKNNIYRRGRFLQLNQDKVIEICVNKEYPRATLAVLYYFHGLAEYGNRVPYLAQTEIAKTLKMTQSEISKAIKQLENDKIIFKKPPYKDYYFSEELLMKGNRYYEKQQGN